MSPPIDFGVATTRSGMQAIGLSADGRREIQPVICGGVLFAADCVAIALALVIVAGLMTYTSPAPRALRYPGDSVDGPGLIALVLGIVGCLGLQGRYSEHQAFWSEIRLLMLTTLCAAGAQAILAQLTTRTSHAGATLGVLLLFPLIATVCNRLARQALDLSDIWTIPVVVIGQGEGAAEAALAVNRALGYRTVARLDPDMNPTQPSPNFLRSLLDRHGARRLIIALDGTHLRETVERALRERVPFTLALGGSTVPSFTCDSTSILSHEAKLLSFQDPLKQPFGRAAKTVIDLVGAASLLVVLSPLFLLLMILCRLDGGPALFGHQRVGEHGRRFRCLKFRTMVVHADDVLAKTLADNPAQAEEWRTSRKLVNDPRITRLGRFLRSTSLDELPQLINVLRLEMSLVGPRPIVESEIDFYGQSIAQYYATRPGLTGLWQVSGRSNTSYAKRVQLDVWYVNNWTIWNDFTVLLKTIPAVIRRQGAC